MFLRRYCLFIIHHSFLLLFTVSLISTVLTVIPLVLRELPSFADPTAGFETRGTFLANRFIAWENLIDETRPSKRLAVNPKDIEDQIRFNSTLYNKTVKVRFGGKTKHNGKKGHKKKGRQNTTYGEMVLESPEATTITQGQVHWGYGKNVTIENENATLLNNYSREQWNILKKMERKLDIPIHHNYASGQCGSPVNSYSHLVIKSQDRTSMLSYKNIQASCNLQSKLFDIAPAEYHNFCERTMSNESMCCPIWSLPNYIALISGKNSCHDVTEEDCHNTVENLHKCAPFFHNFTLMSSCEFDKCNVPKYCSQHNAIYNILFYLIDSEAFAPPTSSNGFVKYSMVFLPLARSSTILPYYNKLEMIDSTIDSLDIPAIDFGLKNTLFDLWIVQDTWLVALGGIFVFLGVWIYTTSAILTLLLMIAVSFSLGIAYFIYVYIFNLKFFPFMNLLVVVVVVGIGADDAFLYVKLWNVACKKYVKESATNQNNEVSEYNNLSSAGETTLLLILEETVKHSAATILFTSLTTAVAFLASYVSYIPAINCFSVFAGTTVLVNFFLMVTWLPSTVFIVDVLMCRFKKLDKLFELSHVMWQEMSEFCSRLVVISITKFHLLFFYVFLSVGVGSIIVVVQFPGLLLPDSRDFQLFQSSHPFEQYDMVYRDMFLFEKFGRDIGIESKMPLRWVWGVKAIDNGNHMNPSSNGHLIFDDDFSISDPKSQSWLLNFCAKLKAQSFYQPIAGPLLPNCFIENFKIYMERQCTDNIDKIDRTPCCSVSVFPYRKQVFEFCIAKAIEALYQTPRELFMPGVAGPKFLKTSSSPPKIAAIVIEFESNVQYSMSYSVMAEFYTKVENWTQNELKHAPPGMKNGWFISDFQFYDLQNTLAYSTSISLVLSAVLGFSVLVPATRSILTSICALSAMIFSAAFTIAILVLSNWKLNVLESVAISTSAGLAVDFSLHYALSYTSASGTDWAKAKAALFSSAGPTGAAALTSGFAGIFLLRSKLLPYSQIGTFLALIMFTSWIYATFFLCSLFFMFGNNRVKTKTPTEERKSVSRVNSICSTVPNVDHHELEQLAETTFAHVTRSHSPSSMSAATTMVIHEDCDDECSKFCEKSLTGNMLTSDT